ncbi:MAG TPA: sigma-54-dependent Fis family transcriptional regulator [Spirochaetes bacterium]|nr:sigma-54-dependent Fis family transcriptional regulator [Spirochaetota bacterium]
MENNISVLVVDDEKNFRSLLDDALSPEGYLVDTAEDGEAGLSKVKDKYYHLAIVDVMMPKKDGLAFLSEALIHQPDLVVIMMSAVNDVERIIDATKKGAFHFLIKPIDLDVLYNLLNQIVEKIKLNEENIKLKEKLSFYESFPSIIGNSPPLMKVIQQAIQIAKTEAFCLILGESGTGKELICDLIHKKSPRVKGPLLKINCAAIPSNLLESELFGHEKGSFTGAYQTKKGLFELADGGTLFLDEIGDLEMALQSKLLRAIELGEFSRVGGQKVIKTNIRVISATHHDLHKKIKNNSFREDLYYRLNVVSVRLPPLRERVEDIPLLANHFIKELSIKNQKEEKPLSQEALSYLMTYPFEGNIRELKNLMERAVVFSTDDTLYLDDMFMDDTFQQEKHYLQIPITASLVDIEKLVINKVLEFNKGDKKKTADMLGVSLRKIFYKIKGEKGSETKDHLDA